MNNASNNKIKKNYMQLFFIVLFLIAIILHVENINVKADESQNINLKKQLIPLITTKAGSGYEDLDRLQPILKDKKIVAMGEATHGTKEFSQMKHRMLEFLVEKMGYRLFAIEGDFGGAQVVNDYVLTGKGDAKDAIKSMNFADLSTEEVVDMVEWIRTYNKKPQHKSKVKFYGFDMQSPINSSARILDYIKKVDNNNLLEFQKILVDVVNDRIDSYSNEMLNNVKNSTEQLKNIFEKNKKNYINKSTISEYEITYKELNIDIQFLDYITTKKDKDPFKLVNMRDYYMAQNVKWILDYEKQYGNDKIMLWAHNGHVTKNISNYTSMGKNLKNIFNDKYYAIGFDFYEGSFRANPCDNKSNILSQKIAKFSAEKSDINSLAYSFEKTGIPLSFMDFKSASKDKTVGAWLSRKQLIHSIGAGYSGNINQWMLPEVPINSYDGLIFIKKTSAAIGIKGYETSINDGDSYIKNHDRNIFISTIATIAVISIIILFVCIHIYKQNSFLKKQ